MRSEHGGGVPRSTTFAQALDELKREGSNLLLVGEATAGAHKAASDRLLGDEGELRRRLFVFTSDNDVCSGLPATETDAHTRVVAQQSAEPGELPAGVERSTVNDEMLSKLARATIDAIDEFEEEAGDLEPGELRLCFDSITSLLRDHQAENVFRLLHLVTSRVRQVGGMGHFHLRLDRDSDHVRVLEPMFDAVVEIRVGDEGPQQRWHLRDREITSDWVPV
jgi:hypothetical protein